MPYDLAPMSSDPLLRWRPMFPIAETTTYLVSHSLGAMPRTVYDRMREFADTWATRGVRAWSEGWWTMPVDVGNVLARVLDAPAGSVVMHQNVSVIESLIASSLEFKAPRNRVVYSDLNFPTVMYVWEAQRKHGAEIVTVRSRDGMTVELEDMLKAIDERTLVVPISHVLFKSSFLQDAAAIVKRAHEVGAMVILDCYQSTGTVPFSARELNVDMVVGGSVKWLCGGPGAGYLYVRPDLMSRFEPAITGWAAHAAPFAFEPGPIRYAADVRRFLHGSPGVPALYAARAGYEIIAEVGVKAIREKSLRLTQWLIGAVEEQGWRVTSPKEPSRRGGTITVAFDDPLDPNTLGPAMAAELQRREILVDHRPGAGVRVSPHLYTTQEDLARFVAEARSILETKAYKAHLGAKIAH